LRHSDGLLAMIASDHFYTEVIMQDPGTAPESYRQIEVLIKSFKGHAWLRVLGSSGGVDYIGQASPPVLELDESPVLSPELGLGAGEVTIHTSGDDGTSVRDAVVELLKSAGYVIVDQHEVELGSWFQRMFVRQLDPSAAKEIACAVTNEVKSATVGSVIQAGEFRVTYLPQQTDQERLVDSAARLLEAIRGHEEVLVYLPPLLLIKIGPQVLTWEVTDKERAIITANPHLLHSPRELLALFVSTTRQDGASDAI
jgi:hypothetical protein